MVRTREQVIAHRLLASGALPNLIIYTTEEISTEASTPSTATLSSPEDPLGKIYFMSEVISMSCPFSITSHHLLYS